MIAYALQLRTISAHVDSEHRGLKWLRLGIDTPNTDLDSRTGAGLAAAVHGTLLSRNTRKLLSMEQLTGVTG
jgi:hypothetical protein